MCIIYYKEEQYLPCWSWRSVTGSWHTLKRRNCISAPDSLGEQLHLERKLHHISPAARLLVTCNNTRLQLNMWTPCIADKSLILPGCTCKLVLSVLQNLTSYSVVLCACRLGESCCRRPRTPGDNFLDLSFIVALILMLQGCCHQRLAERRGMRASPQQASRCRHTCHGRVRERERESLVPETERVMALARGAPRALPSADALCSGTPLWIVARAQLAPSSAFRTANVATSSVYVHLSAF